MEKRTYYNEGNPNNITRAALFIFFMRTCYNGIYSVNHSGKLSVTFGAGGRVKLLEEELIRFNHKLLQDVVILDGDYRQTAMRVTPAPPTCHRTSEMKSRSTWQISARE